MINLGEFTDDEWRRMGRAGLTACSPGSPTDDEALLTIWVGFAQEALAGKVHRGAYGYAGIGAIRAERDAIRAERTAPRG